jgi:DNA-binding NarL/FixJ family response regulator
VPASSRHRATVLVVDGDDELRLLVTGLLADADYAPLEAATGEDALALAATSDVDVVVLEVGLPRLSGYEVCRRLRATKDGTLGIMFVSGSRVEPLDRVAGLSLGADDYLVKPFDPDELLARVRALVRRRRGARAGGELTPRELQVLRLLAEGRTQGEVATALVISPKTVGTHVENILRKLDVHSRTQAVAVAYRSGILGDA